MKLTQYNIFVVGMLCFTKYIEKEFNKVCSDMDTLKVEYTVQITEL